MQYFSIQLDKCSPTALTGAQASPSPQAAGEDLQRPSQQFGPSQLDTGLGQGGPAPVGPAAPVQVIEGEVLLGQSQAVVLRQGDDGLQNCNFPTGATQLASPAATCKTATFR